MLLLPLVLGCKGCNIRNFGLDRTVPPADAPAHAVALAGAKVMIGPGDISRCDDSCDEATARLVESVLEEPRRDKLTPQEKWQHRGDVTAVVISATAYL